ncbi:gag/pol protein [Cucumis melo var. makuwa]|uniref:Gag/pol protein n=1 Tax=Cucumis melo var. makuwa TaxID=1194695 RepID=A0A5D3C7X2_CUCMM|nr:gag/pol protein [Cucumis melo var. makuwa]TYK07575.1 gag/pol protein [Cucumis melo var. makuwa]
MNSSIVQLLASEKLNGDNYAAWKSNLNTILVVDDLRVVLTKECPQTPTSNANRTSRKAYDRWVKADEKACVYILANMTDVLAKKHKFLATAKNIIDALKAMFGRPEWSLRHEAIKYIYTKRMKKRTSVREHVLDMMMHFNIVEVNSGAIDEANQENNSWKTLSEGEITLKVGTGEMVSAKAVGNLKIERLVKSGFLSKLEDNSLPPCESFLEGKMTKRSFTGKGLRAKIPLELVHSDICGPMNVKARGGVSETPYELWKGRKGSLRYPKESRGGLFYDPQENKVFVSTNATFLEEDHIKDHQPRNKLVLNEISKNALDKPSSSTKVVDKTKISGQTHPSQELREPRCSERVVHQPNRYLGLSESHVVIPNDGIEDPLTYKQAMNDVDHDQWIKAMNLEIESMFFNYVWTQ